MQTQDIPQHVGFIMDGNRRWAKEHGLPTLEGHRAGYEKMKAVAEWCAEFEIPQVTVYAFSTENWNRAKEEVGYLMDLLERAVKNPDALVHETGYQVRIIGSLDRLPDSLRKACARINEMNATERKGRMYIALNYGGRDEIVAATQKIIRSQLPAEQVSQAVFAQHLYAPEAANVDLIIRTGGEHRLSNFLLWQAAYAELYVEDTYWPAFKKEHLAKAITWYQKRSRRFGS